MCRFGTVKGGGTEGHDDIGENDGASGGAGIIPIMDERVRSIPGTMKPVAPKSGTAAHTVYCGKDDISKGSVLIFSGKMI